MRRLLIILFGPLYSRLIGFIAFGPWGIFHKLFIRIFCFLYKISWPDFSSYKTLGDFFLRDIPRTISPSPLVSPCEAILCDGPSLLQVQAGVSVKGLQYSWRDFPELKNVSGLSEATFWNFYLAPYHYHWVHAPCEGTSLEAIRVPGRVWPVNEAGRKMAPKLYLENERLSFRWQSPLFGQVHMLCVGALAVSALHCDVGPVNEESWTSLKPSVEKAERLLAFRLGSTVLLILEKAPSLLSSQKLLRVGDDLLRF